MSNASADHTRPKPSASTQTNVLILGCGRMAGALLEQWQTVPGCVFTIAARTVRENGFSHRQVSDIGDIDAASFDCLVLGVKPQQLADAVPPWLPSLSSNGFVLSLAAGVSLDSLSQLMGPRGIARLMPNLPVSIGRGVSGLLTNSRVTQDQTAFLEKLMAPTGTLVTVENETMLDRITAVTGSGTGFALEIMARYADAVTDLGFDRTAAERLAIENFLGAADLASSGAAELATLRDRVISPGGTTEAGLAALRESADLPQTFAATFAAAIRRAIELR